MKKNIIKLIAIPFFIIFVGCGGGNGGGTGSVVALCTDNISDWTLVSSGDVVVGSSDAILKFDHDSENVKKVCVTSGSAHVLKSYT